MKKIAETSNQNLVRNSDAYISNGGKIDPNNEFSSIDDSYQLSKDCCSSVCEFFFFFFFECNAFLNVI